MTAAHYSISAEHGRCVLHLWSEERNMVRTVVGLEMRKETLRLRVRRLGTQRPQSLEVLRDRDQRTPATRALSRTRYLALLERILTRHFNEFRVESLRSAMDLEHSFGPAYARGLLVRGQQCWALIGVNAEESHATSPRRPWRFFCGRDSTPSTSSAFLAAKALKVMGHCASLCRLRRSRRDFRPDLGCAAAVRLKRMDHGRGYAARPRARHAPARTQSRCRRNRCLVRWRPFCARAVDRSRARSAGVAIA